MTAAAGSRPRGLLLAWSVALRVLETATVLAFGVAVLFSVAFVMAWFNPGYGYAVIGEGPDELFPIDVIRRFIVVVVIAGWTIAAFVCYRKRLPVQEDGELLTGLPVWPFTGAAGAAMALLLALFSSSLVRGEWWYEPVTPTVLIVLSITFLGLPAFGAVLGMNWFFKLREWRLQVRQLLQAGNEQPHYTG